MTGVHSYRCDALELDLAANFLPHLAAQFA